MSDFSPDFDRMARPYRWLEYLTLGRALERCRLHFLAQLSDCSRAIVFGDGDGRFLTQLLQQNPTLHADAVDTSSVMLRLLRRRCGDAAARLKTYHTDAIIFAASNKTVSYDLVVSHFFLDCLTQTELVELTSSMTPHLAPGAIWVVSDFRIPEGVMQLPAKLIVRLLYFIFRALTGLQVDRLPDHAAALGQAKFTLRDRHLSLFGILTTEIWSSNSALPAASTVKLAPPPGL